MANILNSINVKGEKYWIGLNSTTIGTGLNIDASGITYVKINNGLNFNDGKEIVVKPHSGITVDANGVSVKVSDGLSFNSSSALTVSVGTGLDFDTNGNVIAKGITKDHLEYAFKNEITAMNAVVSSITEYAKTSDVTTAITNAVSGKADKATVETLSSKVNTLTGISDNAKNAITGITINDTKYTGNTVDLGDYATKAEFNTLLSGANATTAIDSYNEIVEFLKDAKNTENLVSLLNEKQDAAISSYTGVTYPEVDGVEWKEITNGDSVVTALHKLDDNAVTLINEVIDNEEVVAQALTTVSDAVGLSNSLEYEANASANYISGATSLVDADNKLDAAINGLHTVAKSGSYNDLTNKPTIPTSATVSSWGFTKNSGTYSKPSGGIPKSDLASAVQTSLGKADTALQSVPSEYVTETELSNKGYATTSAMNTALGKKANTATTLAGYGITNAYTKTEVDTKLSGATQHIVGDPYTGGSYTTLTTLTNGQTFMNVTSGKTVREAIDIIDQNAATLSKAINTVNTSLHTVAKSGSYNDLTNKPTIPTSATVSSWGFTKNSGTYSKPSGGIPKSDLASAVQTSLGKADTALQSVPSEYVTETELSNKGYATTSAMNTALGKKANTATTLAGYGITNAYTKTEVDTKLSGATQHIVGDPYTGGSYTTLTTLTNGQTFMNVTSGKTVREAIDIIDQNAATLSKAINTVNTSLHTVAKSGSYNDLTNKPTIPTSATVSSWGFTKNSGTYSKPSGGIPKSDLASAVQTSLGKADTALQSVPSEYVTETELSNKGYATTSAMNTALGKKANTATTLAGYGITNAYTKTEVDTKLSGATQHIVGDPYTGGSYTTLTTLTNGQTFMNVTSSKTVREAIDIIDQNAATLSKAINTVNTSLHTVAKSGSYNDLTNKPTIPTSATVSSWGFTKNSGTYSKPSGGIPKSDLASAVQTSLGKADTALQSILYGTGLTMNGSQLEVDFAHLANNNIIFVKPYSGITVDANGVSVKASNGIQLNTDGVQVKANSGITVDANGVSVNEGNGLYFDINKKLTISGGNGVSVAANGISVKGWSGITVDANGVSVKAGNGLVNNASGVSVGAGNGITVAADAISVKTTGCLTASTAGVGINVGASLAVHNNALGLNTTDWKGFTYNSGLTLNVGTGIEYDSSNNIYQVKGKGVISVYNDGVTVNLGQGVENNNGSLRVKVKSNGGITRDNNGIYLTLGSGLAIGTLSPNVGKLVLNTAQGFKFVYDSSGAIINIDTSGTM